MNPKFLSSIPVVLNAPLNDSSSGGITRRSFLKRTGGATVAALVAWNTVAYEAKAAVIDDSSATSAPKYFYYFECAKDPKDSGMKAPLFSDIKKMNFPNGSANTAELRLGLSLTLLGPRSGEKSNSFAYAALGLQAYITCFINGYAISPKIEPGKLPPKYIAQWSSGTYTKTIERDTGVVDTFPATLTPKKVIAVSFQTTFKIDDEICTSIIAAYWEITTTVSNNQINLRTSTFTALQTIMDSSGQILSTLSYADPSTSPTLTGAWTPVSAPKCFASWTTNSVKEKI